MSHNSIAQSRLLYGLPARGPLLNMESVNRTDSFHKRYHHCGFTRAIDWLLFDNNNNNGLFDLAARAGLDTQSNTYYI